MRTVSSVASVANTLKTAICVETLSVYIAEAIGGSRTLVYVCIGSYIETLSLLVFTD